MRENPPHRTFYNTEIYKKVGALTPPRSAFNPHKQFSQYRLDAGTTLQYTALCRARPPLTSMLLTMATNSLLAFSVVVLRDQLGAGWLQNIDRTSSGSAGPWRAPADPARKSLQWCVSHGVFRVVDRAGAAPAGATRRPVHSVEIGPEHAVTGERLYRDE